MERGSNSSLPTRAKVERGSNSSLPTRAKVESDTETAMEKTGTQKTSKKEEAMQEEIKRLKEDLEMVWIQIGQLHKIYDLLSCNSAKATAKTT